MALHLHSLFQVVYVTSTRPQVVLLILLLSYVNVNPSAHWMAYVTTSHCHGNVSPAPQCRGMM